MVKDLRWIFSSAVANSRVYIWLAHLNRFSGVAGERTQLFLSALTRVTNISPLCPCDFSSVQHIAANHGRIPLVVTQSAQQLVYLGEKVDGERESAIFTLRLGRRIAC